MLVRAGVAPLGVAVEDLEVDLPWGEYATSTKPRSHRGFAGVLVPAQVPHVSAWRRLRLRYQRTREQAMAVERTPGGSSLIDVLDRVLDKGIVIDPYLRISPVGIDLVTEEERFVVASIDTHLTYS